MDITQRLQQCVIEPQQKTKIDAFTQVLGDVLASSEVGPAQVQNLKEYVQCVLDEQVGLVVARQLLSDFISLFNERIQDTQVKKQILTYAIDLAQPRSVSFEEQVRRIYDHLDSMLNPTNSYPNYERIWPKCMKKKKNILKQPKYFKVSNWILVIGKVVYPSL